jgi:heme/copper-type cytochrome/quinol oxidase subunit 4
MEPIKTVILILLGAIVVSLGKAMFHMSSGPEHSERTVRALTARISLSIVLFALIMVVWYLGGISPHGAP